MANFEYTTTIERSPAEVWAYAADIGRHTEWMSVADAAVIDGSGTQAGSRGRESLRLGPFTWTMEFAVVEAEPARRLVWRATDDPRMDLEVGLDLEPVESGSTQATYRSAVQLRGRWRLLAPLVSMEGRAGVRRELLRLKANVEV
jgi:uncharacterized protein YndB with AHSA1/START domain